MSSSLVRLTVLLKPDEAERLEAYCQESGRKKSTLVARLIRDHLDATQSPKASRGPKRNG